MVQNIQIVQQGKNSPLDAKSHIAIKLGSSISYTTGLAIYEDTVYVTRSSTFSSKPTSLIAKARDRTPGEVVIIEVRDPSASDGKLFDIDNYYKTSSRVEVVTDNKPYPTVFPEAVKISELVKKPVFAEK
jgi:hypothetical protein